jgi:hypothetical protein
VDPILCRELELHTCIIFYIHYVKLLLYPVWAMNSRDVNKFGIIPKKMHLVLYRESYQHVPRNRFYGASGTPAFQNRRGLTDLERFGSDKQRPPLEASAVIRCAEFRSKQSH